MIKDDPRGVGYLLGEPGPVDPVVQRYKDKMKELQRKPIDNTEDIFSQLPFVDGVNLGVSTPGANTKVTPPEPRDDFGNTKAQKDKMIMAQITRKRKPYDWSPLTKNAAKVMNEEAEVTSPADAKQKKQPYWVNYNGELLDANNAEHWQSVTKTAEKERFNDRIQEQDRKPIHQQLTDLKNWDKASKAKNWDKASKTISTPIGKVKIINSTQKDIANINTQGRKNEPEV